MSTSGTGGSRIDYRGVRVYVGNDTGKKSWQVTVRTRESIVQRFSQDPSTELLARRLRREYAGAELLVGYEAGFCGFWIKRELDAMQIRCEVLNPGDIGTRDKDRRRKTDRLDADRIAAALCEESRELPAVTIPSREQEEARLLSRQRVQAGRASTRAQQQLISVLDQLGIVPPEGVKVTFSQKCMRWLHGLTLETEAGTAAIQGHVRDVETCMRRVTELEEQLDLLAARDPWREAVSLLETIVGISRVSAVAWAVELGPISRFKSRDHLASYVGLVPQFRESSQTETKMGITPRAATYLRPLLVQNTKVAVIHDPELRALYHAYISHKGKTKGEATIAAAEPSAYVLLL